MREESGREGGKEEGREGGRVEGREGEREGGREGEGVIAAERDRDRERAMRM